VTEALRSADLV